MLSMGGAMSASAEEKTSAQTTEAADAKSTDASQDAESTDASQETKSTDASQNAESTDASQEARKPMPPAFRMRDRAMQPPQNQPEQKQDNGSENGSEEKNAQPTHSMDELNNKGFDGENGTPYENSGKNRLEKGFDSEKGTPYEQWGGDPFGNNDFNNAENSTQSQFGNSLPQGDYQNIGQHEIVVRPNARRSNLGVTPRLGRQSAKFRFGIPNLVLQIELFVHALLHRLHNAVKQGLDSRSRGRERVLVHLFEFLRA